MSQASLSPLEQKTDLPAPHAAFLQEALPRLQADERIVAVAAGGSFLTGSMDEYSDLDLVIAVSPAAIPQLMQERHPFTACGADAGPSVAADVMGRYSPISSNRRFFAPSSLLEGTMRAMCLVPRESARLVWSVRLPWH